jgi:hypothetical protein
MYEYGSSPRARQDGLLEEAVGEELLLYDQNSHTAHCLSPVAACVWRHCDGERNLAELAILAGASEDLVADALHELREKYLLAIEPELSQSTVPGESRREAIVRAARYGAAAAAGSMIVSATAATPATAASGVPKCVPNESSEKNLTCCLCKNDCVGGFVTKFDCENFCKTAPRTGFVEYKIEYVCGP